jgi:hypothetical protein
MISKLNKIFTDGLIEQTGCIGQFNLKSDNVSDILFGQFKNSLYYPLYDKFYDLFLKINNSLS